MQCYRFGTKAKELCKQLTKEKNTIFAKSQNEK
jgi:hypothetical protein